MVTPRHVARAAAALFAIHALTGCADLLDLPRTDTLSLAPTGPWRCIGTPPKAAVPATSSAIVRFQVCDFISNCTVPVTGLEARLCDKLDIGCLNPRVTDLHDVDGVIEVEVPMGPRGFDGYLQVLRHANRKHDVVAALISDPRETVMPPAGLVTLEDAETGRTRLVDTRSSEFRSELAANAKRRVGNLRDQLRATGMDLVEFDATGSMVDPLLRFFRERERRLRR